MRILITAGPTREPIDAVRYISNRSSGKLGVELAKAALAARHSVTLLLGPVDPSLTPCADNAFRLYRFESSAELQQLLDVHLNDCDLLIMAAAVADYRPLEIAPGKTPRQNKEPLTLTLHPTPDLVRIAASHKDPHQKVIAFALEEPGQLLERASKKLKDKGVDAIIANPLSTMDSSQIHGILIWADGRHLDPGPLPKPAFAHWLIKQITE